MPPISGPEMREVAGAELRMDSVDPLFTKSLRFKREQNELELVEIKLGCIFDAPHSMHQEDYE